MGDLDLKKKKKIQNWTDGEVEVNLSGAEVGVNVIKVHGIKIKKTD